MRKKGETRMIIVFLLPAIVLFTVMFAQPVFRTIQLSFTEWGGIKPTEPVGLQQYRRLLGDSAFRQSLVNAFQVTLMGAALLFPVTFAMAWGLSQKIKGEKFFQFIVFAPVVLSVPIVAMMWKFIYHPTLGLINPAMEFIGLGDLARPWLADPTTALPAVIVTTVWHGLGVWVVLLLAGFRRLPEDTLNAARVDGASEGQVFRHVTIPLLADLLRILGLLWIVGSLQAFAFIFIMTSGGPFGSSEVPGTLLFDNALVRHNFGYAAAMGTVLGLVILLAVFLVNLVSRRESVEY